MRVPSFPAIPAIVRRTLSLPDILILQDKTGPEFLPTRSPDSKTHQIFSEERMSVLIDRKSMKHLVCRSRMIYFIKHRAVLVCRVFRICFHLRTQRKKGRNQPRFRPLISHFHYLKYFTPLSNSFRSCSPVMFFAT